MEKNARQNIVEKIMKQQKANKMNLSEIKNIAIKNKNVLNITIIDILKEINGQV